MNNILRSFKDLKVIKGQYTDNTGNRKVGRVGMRYGDRSGKEEKPGKICGREEAMSIISGLRSGLFKKFDDDQLQDFREAMADALDLKMK